MDGPIRLRRKLQIDDPNQAIILRRTKERHLEGLPRKHVHRLIEDLSDEQRCAHVAFVRQSRGCGQGAAFSLLSSLNKLCQHPVLLGQGALGDDPLKLVSASPKLRAVLAQLRSISERDEKVLIFAWFRDMQEILRRCIRQQFGFEVNVLNGQTRGVGQRMLEYRSRLIRDFEGKEGFNVLILSPEVAGVGLTIVGANHVLHYGRWWNPAVEDQATDRVHRIGQEKDVHVYYVLSKDPQAKFRTFDERLDSLLERKRRRAADFLTPQADSDSLQTELFEDLQDDAEHMDGEVGSAPTIDNQSAVADLLPTDFEGLIAAMYGVEGYRTVLTPLSNDRGVDIIALSDTEVVFVQCKHAQDGRSFDPSAIDEISAGESFYTRTILPQWLRDRRPRLIVACNGDPDVRSRRDADQRGVQLVTGRALLQRLKNAGVTRPNVDGAGADRADSLEGVRQRLRSMGHR